MTHATTPRGLRPHIVLAGRCNAGKSALLNALVGQEVAIVSDTPGTTTDPVLKASELVPFGPVVFVDTAGIDDKTDLAAARDAKARAAIAGSDVVVYVFHPQTADREDVETIREYKEAGRLVIPVQTHADIAVSGRIGPIIAGIETAAGRSPHVVSSTEGTGIRPLREAIIDELTAQRSRQKTLLEDLVRPYRLIMLIVPIDLEAPAGRLILPQVQTIREVLDGDAATIVVKEREVSWVLDQLKRPPDLAITDSQVVLKASGAVPPEIPLTTFSILFSRFKGDLDLFVRNVARIDRLDHGSRVLITESCSHHTHCDDIGRVKIPRWLRQYTGKDLSIDVAAGPFPDTTDEYELILHCGGCMITRPQMLARMDEAASSSAPITNYGVAISYLHGVLDRVLEPFGLTAPGDAG
ncbi:MAG: [FeFe] hydrogenase H-cluster maturation GTPase HydF [Spirochaetales bacterium]|nr:[FeFe] hydrogenase H-cluster maturation GTPase HydF [Spirochaetales bacterium]